MKKELSGAELVSFIKPRQLKAVRGLRQAHGIQPKLAIVIANDDPVIDTYVRLKQAYAEDITAEVEVYRVAQEMVPELFDEIKKDDSIQGVILQLPLSNLAWLHAAPGGRRDGPTLARAAVRRRARRQTVHFRRRRSR
ncbi:MAG: tetrahydrofolate dehydrogenase/cyclohydrolase catalytic domain-containing protein, partial [Patescibacteria group bacterium]